MKKSNKILQSVFIAFNPGDYAKLRQLGKEVILITGDHLDYEAYSEVLQPNVWRVILIPGNDREEQWKARRIADRYIDLYLFKLPEKFRTVAEYIDSLSMPEVFFRKLNNALPVKFWEWEKNEPKLSLIAYLNFLQNAGYYTFPDRHDKAGYQYIKIEGRVVRRFEEKAEFVREAKTYTMRWLYDRAENMKVRNKILTSSDLNEKNLSQLAEAKLDFQNSGEDFQNFFFADGYMWEVRDGEIRKYEQKRLSKYIWADDIIDAPSKVKPAPFRIFYTEAYKELLGELEYAKTREEKNLLLGKIKDMPDSEKYDIEILDRQNYFLQFLWLTSYIHWQEAEMKGYFIEPDHFWYELEKQNILEPCKIDEMKLHLINKITWLGYFMRDYRGPQDDYGLAILDAIDLKNENLKREAAGGGKSLITKAIARVKRTYIVKADAEEFTTNKHRYENYRGEKVMVLDDMHKNSRIGDILTDFSNGITINPKHKKPIELSLQESPKIIITRNYIDLEGARVDRRLGRIFVSDFFHDNKSGKYKTKRTPMTYFGRSLFVSDSDEQKSDLVNFFAYAYIANQQFGEVNSPVDELYFYRIIKEIGEPLIEFLDVFLADENNFGYIDLKWLYDKFKVEYKDSFSQFQRTKMYNTTKNFKQLIAKYCELKGYVYTPDELKNSSGRIIRRSEYRLGDTGGVTAEHIFISPVDKYEELASGKGPDEDLPW